MPKGQRGDRHLIEGGPVDIKWGYNSDKDPVVGFYHKDGRFIVQIKFDDNEQRAAFRFWNLHFRIPSRN